MNDFHLCMNWINLTLFGCRDKMVATLIFKFIQLENVSCLVLGIKKGNKMQAAIGLGVFVFKNNCKRNTLILVTYTQN